ncbi:EamA family transporter [Aeromonas schubertii]|uniref:EamA family transporter n=1 Tax=Aeromonas schubertii TaxID=652 RepID=UPI001CC6D440|nr:EamA family transporter [Aeromonas schubertii]MBZ6071470.1 EamA family transporter [Aeromonas schubertii]
MPASDWLVWALLSALFAALTAILAKLGLQEVDPDLATLIRTLVLLPLLALVATGKWGELGTLSGRTWLFLILSGVATGASWLCYFRALKVGKVYQVAPVDKLSLVLVTLLAVLLLGERPQLREWLALALISGGVLLLALRR